ncbi:MAG: hypothetical protein Q8P51_15450 [Ignavibacteria bacterium]|nr:hypothetical protein [Ignavibacteria bacterium]
MHSLSLTIECLKNKYLVAGRRRFLPALGLDSYGEIRDWPRIVVAVQRVNLCFFNVNCKLCNPFMMRKVVMLNSTMEKVERFFGVS